MNRLQGYTGRAFLNRRTLENSSEVQEEVVNEVDAEPEPEAPEFPGGLFFGEGFGPVFDFSDIDIEDLLIELDIDLGDLESDEEGEGE